MEQVTTVICPNCGEDNDIKNKNCHECNNDLLLNNKYHLLKVIGENIGITYVGVTVRVSPSAYPQNPTYAVIKELPIKSVDRWKTEELFKREGNILKSLDHKSIPKFIEQFTLEINKNISYFLVMEQIQGITIEEELKEKMYTEEEVFSFIKEVAEILSYLQSFRPPIIHRDIKPSNLIRKHDGSIAIIDFGGVKDAIKQNVGSTVAGTFGYVSPEQVLGRAVIQSDFYSLGITALVMLTKKDINDLSKNLDLNSNSYAFLSNKMILLIDKLIANDVEDRFKNTNEIIDFIDSKKAIKNRDLESKTIKVASGNQVQDFLDYYYELYEIWSKIEEEKKRKNKWQKWLFISSFFALYIILQNLPSELIFFIGENIQVLVVLLLPLTYIIHHNYRVKHLKKFLNIVFNKKSLKNIELEALYSFYEVINSGYTKSYTKKSKEMKLFKRKVLKENKKDKKRNRKQRFKSNINAKKVILDNTKVTLYKQIIRKYR